MDNKLSELSKPVAEVVSKFGDPEAFGEREIKLLTGIQQMAYGTKFYSQEYVSAILAELEAKDKRIAELEAHNARLREWNAGLAQESCELQARLATPVRLPRTLWYEHDDLAHEIPVLEKKKVVAEIRAAGFKVEGDE